MAEIAAEFFPPGVFNVVCGDRDTGRAVVSHKTPAMVSITGSTRAGYEVAEAAAKDLKRTHLELGGKAPVIVFDDADIENAAENIAIAGYFNAGQDCTAATRVLVGPRVADDFAAALAEQARDTRTGPPDDADVLYGPLNNANQLERVGGFFDRLPDHASVLAGGARQGDAGYFWQPTVVGDLQPGRRGDPERDLRPGHHRAAVHRRGRGDALGQRRRVRAGVLGVDEGPRPGDAGVAAAGLRLRVGQRHIPLVAEMPHGGFKHSGLRQGPVGLRPRGLHPHQARHAQHRLLI